MTDEVTKLKYNLTCIAVQKYDSEKKFELPLFEFIFSFLIAALSRYIGTIGSATVIPTISLNDLNKKKTMVMICNF